MINIEWEAFFKDHVIFGFTMTPASYINQPKPMWEMSWILNLIDDPTWHGCWTWSDAREVHD